MKQQNSIKKRLFSYVLAMLMIVSAIPVIAAAKDYDDLDWAKSTIESFIQRKIITPDADGNINPNKLLTRAEMAAVINRTLGFTKTAAVNYSDVQSTDAYYKDIQIAKGTGYMQGDAEGTFRPNEPIARQEMSIIVSRILELAPDMAAAKRYADYDAMPTDEAKGAIGAMSAVQVLQGVGGNRFDPVSSITRAQAYVMVERAEKVYKELQSGAKKYSSVSTAKSLGGEIAKNYHNLTVTAKDVTLTNLIVHGNLTISASVGDGDVILDNVTVEGTMFVYGGGSNSIKVKDSTLNKITVNKENNAVRIELTGKSAANEVNFKSGATIQAAGVTIPSVTISRDVGKGNPVSLAVGTIKELIIQGTDTTTNVTSGKVDSVVIESTAKNSVVDIARGATVGEAIVNAVANITGQGTLTNAEINVRGDISGMISTPNTSVTNVNGDTVKNDASGNTPSSAPSDTGSGSTSGSSSGGGGTTAIPPVVGGGTTGQTTKSVTTESELKAAIVSGYNVINVTDDIELTADLSIGTAQNVVIETGATLNAATGSKVITVGGSLTVKGTLTLATAGALPTTGNGYVDVVGAAAVITVGNLGSPTNFIGATNSILSLGAGAVLRMSTQANGWGAFELRSGTATVKATYSIAADEIFTINSGATLVIEDSVTVTNAGTIVVNGTLTKNSSGAVSGGTVTGTDFNGDASKFFAARYTLTGGANAYTYDTLSNALTAVKNESTNNALELLQVLDSTLTIDGSGTGTLIVKDGKATAPLVHTAGIYINRSKVVVDGLKFSSGSDNLPTTGHYSAISVSYVGGGEPVSDVTIQNCIIDFSTVNTSSALIGIYYDGDKTSNTHTIGCTITVKNQGSGGSYGIYGRTNTLKNNIITSSHVVLLFEWAGEFAKTVTLGTGSEANTLVSERTYNAATRAVAAVQLSQRIVSGINLPSTSFGAAGSTGLTGLTNADLKALINTLLAQLSTSTSKYVTVCDYATTAGNTATHKYETYTTDSSAYWNGSNAWVAITNP